MLSPSQVESLKNISDVSVRKKYLKFFQLPQKLRQAIPAIETNDQIRKAAGKNNLNEEQLWNFSYIVGMVLLGETNITEFVREIQEKCEMNEESSRQIARNINQTVFLPVKEELKKIHQRAQWPRENEEKTARPEKNEPQLDGNIVNLKGE